MITNVIELGNNLSKQIRELLLDKGLVGQPEWDEVLFSLDNFINILNTPLVSKELDNYQITKRNKIENLGIVNEVVDMIEEGMTPHQISSRLKVDGLLISVREVSEFIEEYNEADILTKIDKSNISVFDTESQLERIFTELNNNLESLNNLTEEDDIRLGRAKVVKESLKNETIREIRHIIKDAAAIMNMIANLQTVREFNKVMLEEIRKESPAVAARIQKRLVECRTIFKAIY